MPVEVTSVSLATSSLASRADTKPGLTISLPQLYFQGGCGKRCEEEKETEAKRVNWGRNGFWGWTAKLNEL